MSQHHLRLAIAASALLLSTVLAACEGAASESTPLATTPPLPPESQVAKTADQPSAAEQPPASDGPVLAVVRSSRFLWPAEGPITTYFGNGHPTGIDIGLSWDEDSPVRSSIAGEVTFAGGNPCCSYGIYVEVESEGVRTLYGHLSSTLVEAGQKVQQGQVLGLGGATGASDGKHLHFELYEDGSVVDPQRYLPLAQDTAREQRTAYCGESQIPVDPASRLAIKLISAQGAEYEIEEIKVTSEGITRALAVEAATDGTLAASVEVPRAPAASGQVYQAALELTLRKGEERQMLTCALAMQTLRTLPNPPGTRRAIVPPPPTPTATPFFWRIPTATPRPGAPKPVSPYSTPTPRPIPVR